MVLVDPTPQQLGPRCSRAACLEVRRSRMVYNLAIQNPNALMVEFVEVQMSAVVMLTVVAFVVVDILSLMAMPQTVLPLMMLLTAVVIVMTLSMLAVLALLTASVLHDERYW